MQYNFDAYAQVSEQGKDETGFVVFSVSECFGSRARTFAYVLTKDEFKKLAKAVKGVNLRK